MLPKTEWISVIKKFIKLIKEVKHTSTIFDAWLQAESMVTVNRVIESNTERFSDEKVINKNLE